MKHSTEEIELLQLLKELQCILSDAINSLGGQTPKSPESHYVGFSTVSVNTAADGYLVLREAHRVNASKPLIRQALEAIIFGVAVEKQHGILFRKAFSEWQDWNKMIKDPNAKIQHKKTWEDFEKKVRKFDAACPIDPRSLTVKEAAEIAKMSEHYEISYRIYCKFTHGALEALAGNLNSITDCDDSRVMIWCAFQAIGLLQRNTPAKFPDLKPLFQKIDVKIFQPT
jgi:hypothetical protein